MGERNHLGKLPEVECVVANALRKHLKPHICASAIGPASFDLFTGDLTFLSRKRVCTNCFARCQRSHDPAAFVLRRAIPLLSVRFLPIPQCPGAVVPDGCSARWQCQERIQGTSSERVDLLSALAAQEITIVDEVQLQPSLEAVPRTRRREGRPPESESATIQLDLAAHEEAMVLLEQDGFYSWHLTPQIEESQVPSPRGRRGLAPAAKTARFAIEFQREPQKTPAPQQRGFVKDLVIAQARNRTKVCRPIRGGQGDGISGAQCAARPGRNGQHRAAAVAQG